MAGMQELSTAIERAPIFLGLDKHVLARITGSGLASRFLLKESRARACSW